MSMSSAMALVLLAPAQGMEPGPQHFPIGEMAPAAARQANPEPAATAITATSTDQTAASPLTASPPLQVAPPPAAAPLQAMPSPQPSLAAPPPGTPALQADIVVTARPRGDPLHAVNKQAFNATQRVDEAMTGPAALAYKRAVPDPVRSGLRNFFNNLHEPNVALNYLLQLKPGKAAETVGRFALNTTLGAAGLFDVAKRKPFGLPRRPNGFADTMSYYGVRPGPFFFIPLIGPTTARDFVGGSVDRLLGLSFLPKPLGGRTYILSTGTVRILDRRAESDDRVRTVRESADPYETRRLLYMHKREAEIEQLHGRRAAMPEPSSTVPAEPPRATDAAMPPPARPAPTTTPPT